MSHPSLLYLAPTHNPKDTRPLPITLGRTTLASWWWMACICMGHTTRMPCADCKLLGANVESLSRSMVSIDRSGILTLNTHNKNSKLIRLNGQFILKKQVQLCDGDVFSIGRYKATSWMTFRLRIKRVVTPKFNKRVEKRALPSMKKSIKRRRHEHDDDGEIISTGLNQSQNSLSSAENLTTTIPARRKRTHSWLNKAVGHGGRLLVSQRKVPFEDPSARKSQTDLFRSVDGVLPRITPQRRISRTVPDDQTKGDDSQSISTKRKRCVNRYSPGKRSKQWSLGGGTSPEEDDEDAGRPREIEDDAKQNERDSESKVASKVQDTSGEASSSKKELGTQDDQIGPPSQGATGKDDGSWLSLPHCPTYQTASPHSYEAPLDEILTEPANRERPKTPEEDENLSEPEHDSSRTGDTVMMEQRTEEEQGEADKPRFAADLTVRGWSTIRNTQSGAKAASVRQSLANMIVAQRLQEGGGAWLPDILRNAVVDRCAANSV